MIKSMTGFGRYEEADEQRRIIVEMKAVNHRYSDISIRMPKKLNYFESAIRGLLKGYIQRGKVDVFITYEDYADQNVCVKYNRDIAAEYVKYLNQMAGDFSLDNDIRVSGLCRLPEVLSMEERSADEEEIWKHLREVLEKAAEGFVESRLREGENLKNDLLGKLAVMLSHVEFIERRAPEILSEYQSRLKEKVQELLADLEIDESRILTEVTLFADKVCVDEELVRLRSHIETMSEVLKAGGEAGRKLDFLAQEMNREANTILSKASDLSISNRAIDLKTDIEKVREQIQNIE